jgi:threonine dehydratase
LVRLVVNALDRAGGLGAIATIVGAGGGNIVNVQHERIFGGATARATDVAIDLELANPEELTSIMANIKASGFPVTLSPFSA